MHAAYFLSIKGQVVDSCPSHSHDIHQGVEKIYRSCVLYLKKPTYKPILIIQDGFVNLGLDVRKTKNNIHLDHKSNILACIKMLAYLYTT